jgi:beta-lactamase class A
MKSRVLSYLAILAVGAGLGFFSREMLPRNAGEGPRTRYLEHRQGQSGNTNPLLACDAASEVLSDPEIGSFKQSVETFLNARPGEKTSVYFRELNDGLWFSIGDVEQYIPASLRKVPLMIAVLKQAEKETGLLDRKVTFAQPDDSAKQNFKPSQGLVFGNAYSVKDLISRMIVYSDNNAFQLLTKIVNPAELIQVYSNLRMLDPQNVNSDNFLSVQTYESFFRVLYNCSYLSRSASDWALELLSKSEFATGLVGGVPRGVKVAHKFGEKSEENGTVQLHDCGIVYYPQHPYLLCVMSKGQSFESLSEGIAGVSRLVYAGIDAQARKPEPATSPTPQ